MSRCVPFNQGVRSGNTLIICLKAFGYRTGTSDGFRTSLTASSGSWKLQLHLLRTRNCYCWMSLHPGCRPPKRIA